MDMFMSILWKRMLLLTFLGVLTLACLHGTLKLHDQWMREQPALREASTRGTGFVWEIRRTLATISWVRAQDYFHRGFAVADFIRSEDLEAFEQHEREDIGKMRESIMARTETPLSHSDAVSSHSPDTHEACDDPGHQHDKHCDHDDHEHDDHCDHDDHHTRFGLDTHPLMQRSWLRPYTVGHEHGEGGVAMMLPWYWLTTTLDPHFIRAFSNGAWWLAFVRKDVDRALDYLNRGLLHNPGDADLLMARGEIAFRLRNDPPAAIRDFQGAVADAEPGSEVHEFSMRYLAFALERAGDKEEACRVAREGIQLYSGHVAFETIAARNCP